MTTAHRSIPHHEGLALSCAAGVACLAVISCAVLLFTDDSAQVSAQAFADASTQVALHMPAKAGLPAQAGQPQAY